MTALRRFFCLLPLLTALGLPTGPLWAQTLIVSTAASLSNALTELGESYQSQNPGIHIDHNFAASGVLLQQIARGAPVDIFISADQATMDRAQSQQLIKPATRSNFVDNQLVLIQNTQNSKAPITALESLNTPAITRIAIGKPDSVPAGRYARQVLQAAELWDELQPRFIYAENVRQVLDYVARGEVDAGFVYLSDALLMPDKVAVAQTLQTPEPVSYPLAIVSASTQPDAAAAFRRYLLSDEARTLLERYGFKAPQN